MSSHERAQHDEANNVTYQRCQYAYEYAVPFIRGKKVLDIGCGLAYGTSLMAEQAAEITGFDYDASTVNENKIRYNEIKNLNFIRGSVPPLPIEDKSYDVVTAFQFIEHIHPRKEFIKESLRVLKPGGVLLITTPNNKKSLARNPFHVHEYTFNEMQNELKNIGARFELAGLNGNKKVNDYYEANGKFVRAILKWDILGLHKRLPSQLLAGPYNFITNLMRNRLKTEVKQTTDISTKDFQLQSQNLDETWDIYALVYKD